MLIYRFRPDMVFDTVVEVPAGTTVIPAFHTFQAPPEQEGYYAIMQGGWKLIEGEKPQYPPAPSLQDIKDAKLAEVSQKVLECFAEGFLVQGSNTKLDGQILQVRDLEDRTNWLTSQAAYGASISAGYGSVPGATFRTVGNTTHTLTFLEGYKVLMSMADWGGKIMQRSWELKDAIRASESIEELNSIDVHSNWP